MFQKPLGPLAALLAIPAFAATVDVQPTQWYRTFSHTNPVLKRIAPGDHVTTRTLDSGGYDEKGVSRAERGNPLTGPFYIEGAQPGDAVVIRFHRMRLNRNWGYTAYRLLLQAVTPQYANGEIYPGEYKKDLVQKGRSNAVPWDLDLANGRARLREPNSSKIKLDYPVKPMLGCVGVAAQGDFAPTSTPSGEWGGNLDYNRVNEGSAVILPVFHPGALVFIGDGHALQGDGESTGTGIETSMDVEFSVDVIKKAAVTGPRVETADAIISVGAQAEFQSSLDRALQLATTDMVKWLTSDYGLEPWAAHLVIGYQGRYDVVTVQGSMALRIPKSALPKK